MVRSVGDRTYEFTKLNGYYHMVADSVNVTRNVTRDNFR